MRIFKKKTCGFSKFSKIEFFRWQILEFLIIHKPLCTHVRSHIKFKPDRFSRFDVYWIQTNRQTDRQDKFINRYRINLLVITKTEFFLQVRFPLWINFVVNFGILHNLVPFYISLNWFPPPLNLVNGKDLGLTQFNT